MRGETAIAPCLGAPKPLVSFTATRHTRVGDCQLLDAVPNGYIHTTSGSARTCSDVVHHCSDTVTPARDGPDRRGYGARAIPQAQHYADLHVH